MHPAGLLLAMTSFWSISAVGVYLMVVSIGGLRSHAGRGGAASISGRLVKVREMVMLGLGLVLAAEGVFFTYAVTYGLW
ncbi:MAG: hypothetical protein HY677_00400 [Chloroflexi bacterium]|nr:hypothetical protein [Chloroflexota bacterium]